MFWAVRGVEAHQRERILDERVEKEGAVGKRSRRASWWVDVARGVGQLLREGGGTGREAVACRV